MFLKRHLTVVVSLLLLAFVLWVLVISAGRFRYEQVLPARVQAVVVSDGLSSTAKNAILSLTIFEPVDASQTNGIKRYCHRSLQSPVGSGSSSDNQGEAWNEERLIEINTDGFRMRFTKQWRLSGAGQEIHQGTNVVQFPFGQITETNVLNWKIVGEFK